MTPPSRTSSWRMLMIWSSRDLNRSSWPFACSLGRIAASITAST